MSLTTPTPCLFCAFDRPLVAESSLAVAVEDAYPVSLGHTLVLPRRHAPTYFECTADKKAAIWEMVERVRNLLAVHRPDGFNVGFNAGTAAGQTVLHAHVHVIPRYRGDVPDPRGGIRGVVPGKAHYWK